MEGSTKAPPEGPSQQSPPQSETDVERMVKARQAARKASPEGDKDGGGTRTTNQVIRAAARGEKLAEDEVHDALEFYLAEEGEEPEIEPKPLKLNLGTTKDPKYIKWVIVPVDDEEIVQIRKRATKGTRVQKRRGEADTDENLVARRIVVRGTVEPDLGQLATQLQVVDPADALLTYFRKFGKTGLILQISGEILNASGYDEDDVSELDAALG